MSLLLKVLSVPSTMNRVGLANAFSQFGSVVSAKIEVDAVTGQSKGMGFVQFETSDALTRAKQSGGVMVGDVRLTLEA